MQQIKWMEACKKVHNTPGPNNNHKSTIENTPIVADLAKTRLVETTDHKYVIRMSK